MSDQPEILHNPGDVFQINEKHGRKGWIGAFILCTEVRAWGIVGFVSHVHAHEEQRRAYIRLKWEEIDFVGTAPLVLDDKPVAETSDKIDH